MKKTTFVTYYSESYSELADIVLPNRKKYCDNNNYKLVIYKKPIGPEKGPGFNKINFIREELKTADIVVWNGIDVAFMNLDFKLSTILDRHDTKSIILTSDLFGINSDNMIFKKCAWSEQLLQAIDHLGYCLYKNHVWAEQEALIRFAQSEPYVGKIGYEPQNSMNSYLNQFYGRPITWPGNYKEGDWLIHLPGIDMPSRLKIAKMLCQKTQ